MLEDAATTRNVLDTPLATKINYYFKPIDAVSIELQYSILKHWPLLSEPIRKLHSDLRGSAAWEWLCPLFLKKELETISEGEEIKEK